MSNLEIVESCHTSASGIGPSKMYWTGEMPLKTT
ncbi:hypothetical protein M3J09_010815 [Ascochyta lentis]